MVLAAGRRGASVALDFPLQGERVSLSYGELGVLAREIARGLIALGIDAGERVAILSSTRAEWTLADCGILCAGAIVVPVYHTNSPEECAYVLSHSEARAIFCEDAGQAAKIEQVRKQLPRLRHVILIDDDGADGAATAHEGSGEGGTTGAETLTLAELRARGAEVPQDAVRERVQAVSAEDPASLVYTSGTTGPPKGCMLSHANLLGTARIYAERLQIEESHVLYQFLPLAHVLARVAQYVILLSGAQMSFWSGDPTRIVDELAELQPTHFPAVPRIFEKIHAAVLGRIEDGPALQRTLFRRALARSRAVRRMRADGLSPGPVRLVRHRVTDRLVLAKVRAIFGGRLQVAMVGAAPVARELLEFFEACGVTVLEGYGLTESTAAATLNTPAEMRLGTVGRPLPGTEVRIAADGEILLRGPNVFAGYYKDAKASAQALHDGWLASGDLGEVTAEGYVVVTGRKKDLIITSSGKNITPVNIENALRDTRWISEAVVYGDERPYLVALLTLDRDEQVKLAERLHVSSETGAMAHDSSVHGAVQQVVDDVNSKLARIEQVKRFAILDHDLSQGEGELTPTLKVKRAVVYDRYADIFDGLYRTETPP
jgi:long-chain acyl-CoA synthetase